MRFWQLLIIGFLFSLASSVCFAQKKDSSQYVVRRDTSLDVTITTRHKDKKYRDPAVAAWRSTVLPGWGQVYNQRWYKLPIVYGGLAFIVWLYDFNNSYYKKFYNESVHRSNKEYDLMLPEYKFASDAGINTVRDYYRRNRDLTVLAFFAFWGIQVVDAYVDAKFFQFDISDDLTLKIRPTMGTFYSNNINNSYLGLSFKIDL